MSHYSSLAQHLNTQACMQRNCRSKGVHSSLVSQLNAQACTSLLRAAELEALAKVSNVVPDTWLSSSLSQLSLAKAATVSSLVLIGLLRGSGGHREYEVRMLVHACMHACCRLTVS